jgi:DNA-binding transcriptional MerR regulator/methylmalonyl-CoA mutase cobalamin-binding subunit
MTSDPSKTPTFNMKVVVQETGIKPDTLRAWERRYGLPNPERTSGGHRIYSQYEIDMLKWLLDRQEEGMNISHAVELWQQIKEEGREPLQTFDSISEATSPTAPEISGDQISAAREAWLEACLSFNEYEAQHILAQTFALFPVDLVCFEVLQKGLAEVGMGWYEGTISVQQEHFTSELAVRQLETLLSAATAVTKDGRILVASPPEEQHTFSSLLLSLLLRRRGWDVVYLGANVPRERLEATLQAINPRLMIMAAQTLPTAGAMLDVMEALNRTQTPLAFGGQVFNQIPELRRRMPGHFLGPDLQKAPQRVASLMESLPPSPQAETVDAAYQAALAHYRQQRPSIAAEVRRRAAGTPIQEDHLETANQHLGNNIIAALKLGDMNLLQANIDWIQGLLLNYNCRLSDEMLSRYLIIYEEAARRRLDERGAPILAWFDALNR